MKTCKMQNNANQIDIVFCYIAPKSKQHTNSNIMRTLLIFLFSFYCILLTNAQKKTDPTLLSIGNEKITKSEFMRVYKKNNSQAYTDNKLPSEYLELFINYKLKVHEAKKQGLDTLTSFKTEFNNYLEQLAKPYLTDTTVTEVLAKEAYNRMKQEVHVAHIVIRLNQKSTPSDTLAAWNKINQIRKRILAGEDFIKVAKETSEEPRANETGGDLGFFSAFQMIYPFESMAYNTAVGSLSVPFRTNFGYHILKVIEKRPARGELHAAHIALRVPQDASTSVNDSLFRLASDLTNQIHNGADFAELAKKWSSDQGSKNAGGDLGWFGPNRMIRSFDSAAYSLNTINEISTPIRTRYGWHIIKLLGKRDGASYINARAGILEKIRGDERALQPKLSVINRIKKENKFKETEGAFRQIYTVIDSGIYKGTWKTPASVDSKKALFTIGKKSFSLYDFGKYIEINGHTATSLPLNAAADKLYTQWKEECILNFEKDLLPSKFPEYKNLVQEYYEGILLFNITEKEVWGKAAKDSAGLAAYYATLPSKYLWQERSKCAIYSTTDSTLANKAYTSVSGNFDAKKIEMYLCSKENDSICLRKEEVLFEKGENNLVDLAKKLSPIEHKNGEWRFALQLEQVPSQAKTLEEARGLYLSDYQTELENKWIKALRNSYTYSVDKKALETLNSEK